MKSVIHNNKVIGVGDYIEEVDSFVSSDNVIQKVIAKGAYLINEVPAGNSENGWLYVNGRFIEDRPKAGGETAALSQVPQEITMRQARLALLGAGLLSQVQPAIDGLSEPQRSAANIEWEFSNTLQRRNAFVLTLGPALGLTDAQIDALFITGADL